MSVRRRKAAARAERRSFWQQWDRDTQNLRFIGRYLLNKYFAPDRAADDGWPPND